MRSFLKKFSSVIITATLLIGCAEQGGSLNKQQVGTVLGGALGAVAGAQFGKGHGRVGAIALGTLAGAMLGNSVGSNMDKVDQMHALQTSQRALETAPAGQAIQWRNPDTGNHGSITPTKTYQIASGDYCREFTQSVTVAGKTQQAYGRACRQPDGTWKIVE